MSNCNCNKMKNYNLPINISSHTFPTNYLYGHAYTPNQNLNNTFTPEKSLKNGTLFPELVSIYNPSDSIQFINYLRNGGY